MRWSVRVFLFSLLSTLGFARVASADDASPIDFSLEYSAEPGCPDESAFETALRARLPAARRVAASEALDGTPLIRVRLPAGGSAQKREIRANLPDGTSFRREVPDVACVDAMQSMAVIAAMALEGNQRALSSGSPVSPVKAPPQRVPTAEVATASPRRSSPVASRGRVEATVPTLTPRASWQWSVLASAGIEAGVAPYVAPAFALGLELRDPSARDFSPGIRVSGLFAQSLTERFGSADVRFRLLAARLDFCPTRLRSGRSASTACFEAEAGQLHGSAEHVAKPRDQNMPWLGLGLVARAEVALSRSLGLELGASGRGLPVHDNFVLNPSQNVYQVQVIAWDFLVGLGYHWR